MSAKKDSTYKQDNNNNLLLYYTYSVLFYFPSAQKSNTLYNFFSNYIHLNVSLARAKVYPLIWSTIRHVKCGLSRHGYIIRNIFCLHHKNIVLSLGVILNIGYVVWICTHYSWLDTLRSHTKTVCKRYIHPSVKYFDSIVSSISVHGVH